MSVYEVLPKTIINIKNVTITELTRKATPSLILMTGSIGFQEGSELLGLNYYFFFNINQTYNLLIRSKVNRPIIINFLVAYR